MTAFAVGDQIVALYDFPDWPAGARGVVLTVDSAGTMLVRLYDHGVNVVEPAWIRHASPLELLAECAEQTVDEHGAAND